MDDINLIDILKHLIKQANEERRKAEATTTEAERQKHIAQANEFIKGYNDLTPADMHKELFT